MNKNGLRIGHYRITPLGLTVLAALLVIILALILVITLIPSTPGAAKPNSNSFISVQLPDPTFAPQGDAPVASTPAPIDNTTRATIRSLGEIAIEGPLLSTALDNASGAYVFGDMFSMISDVISNAHYTVADVEGPMSDTAVYGFSANSISTPSSLIYALKSAGVDMLTLANDHSLDNGWDGLKATMQNCIYHGMDYIGASSSQTERNTPVVRNINGINVAFLNYTDSLGDKQYTTDEEATVYGVNWVNTSSCQADTDAARAAGADVIIAYVSWGEMFSRNPNNDQYNIATALANCGVDVVIGYNPHTVQPFLTLKTEIDGKPHTTYILGATGNFLSNRRDQYTDSGIILQFDVVRHADGTCAIENLAYIPTYVWRTDNGNGTYEYRTLAVGQWLDTQPEGMSYADYTRMKQVWAEMQTTLGTEVAACLKQ